MSKILVITSRFPFPLEKGDKLRIYHQIKYFSKSHQVYLVAVHHTQPTAKELEELKPYCADIKIIVLPIYRRMFNVLLALAGSLPFQVAYFFSKSGKKQISAYIHRIQPDAIYSHLIRSSEYVKHIQGVKMTLDYMDCFSHGYFLKIKKTKNYLRKWVYTLEYKRLKKYEAHIFNYFQHHSIISLQDREVMPCEQKNRIEIVANGVDFSIYHPLPTPIKFDLLFSGNMGYPPNIDAAYYTANEILPLILQEYPQAKLLIAGINPPAKIKQLVSKHIEVIEVFEHIRDAYAQSCINVVPVITSIGLQNKLLQAMAMKIPNVTTVAGARGIGAENTDVLLVGHTPAELAQHILTLLNNKDFRLEVVEKGYQYALKHFNWDHHNAKILSIILS
jgi:glycosyltransferase involved in cell wall biosynthesis